MIPLTSRSLALPLPLPTQPNDRSHIRFGKLLLAYVTAAGAGLGACASNAQAEIVYTPVNANVHFDYFLDLNNDGVPDFHIHSSYLSAVGGISIVPLVSGDGVVATEQSCGFDRSPAVAALSRGAVIGPGLPFLPAARCMVSLDSLSYGPWVGQKDRFIGVVFKVDGSEHFGWVRVTVPGFTEFCRLEGCAAGVVAYAYETVPGKPIVAGNTGQATHTEIKPGTLSTLALGALGSPLWRREETQERCQFPG